MLRYTAARLPLNRKELPVRSCLLLVLACCAGVSGQTRLEVPAPEQEVHPDVRERLGESDRKLFDKLARAPR